MARTVVVIGNCTLDLAFRLERFPLPGETLLTDHHTCDVGGKGANQAVAAARMGVDVVFCSAVGTDHDGRVIREHLGKEGIDVEHVREAECPTDVSIIYVTDSGENSIVSTHSAAHALRRVDVDATLEAATAGDVVLMQGNLDRGLTEYTLHRARHHRLTTILNPAPIQYPYDALLPYVDYAVPNEVELRQLASRGDAIAGAQRLLELGAGRVIATLGPMGAILIETDGTRAFAAASVDAVDTTGAGDVFCGVLAAAIALATPLGDAIGVGIRAATLSVTRPGTQSAFPSRDELSTMVKAGV